MQQSNSQTALLKEQHTSQIYKSKNHHFEHVKQILEAQISRLLLSTLFLVVVNMPVGQVQTFVYTPPETNDKNQYIKEFASMSFMYS